MSFELVLLLVLFVVPLLQRVLRAARQGDHRVPDDANGGLSSANQPATGELTMAVPAVPPPPPAAHRRELPAVTPRPKTSRRDARESRAPKPTVRPRGRRPMPSVAGLDDQTGLRRAMVLMAILGPCRAHDPHTRSESGLP